MLNQTLLSISKAAEQLDIHPDSIRRWEKKGLIKAFRDENNHRVFSLCEIQRIQSQSMESPNNLGFQVLKTEYPRMPATSIELFAGAGGLALGFENALIQKVRYL